VVSTTRPTSSSPQHYISPRDTRPLEDRANNSCNYILDNLINGLAKKSDNKDSKNIKDGKNVIDEGKAKNYSDGFIFIFFFYNHDSRDSNSSDSNKGNKARGYIG
jgi:hypothetical protein